VKTDDLIELLVKDLAPWRFRSILAGAVAGGIIIAAIMLIVFPVLIMFGGAIWSALVGWLLVEDADQRGATPNGAPSSE
jgi:hypothetical protein